MQYQKVLAGEQADIDEFQLTLQEIVFDYFNLITKEYYLGVDKWSSDTNGYVKEVKAQYEKVDKEIEEEEMEEELPAGLDKKVADGLLTQKEQYMMKVIEQIQSGQSQNKVNMQDL